MNRRRFVQSLGALSLASQLPTPKSIAAASSTIKPRRLAPGDTVALVSPASATFNTVDLQIAKESLEALGFKVKAGEHMMERHGYLAGEDKARAEDINKAFADKSVAAVHAIRGGWGSARVLPSLDFDTIRQNPKVLIGYSDITALLLSIQGRTGLITFHGPIGLGRWDPWSLDYYKRVLLNGEQVTYTNKQGISTERNSLTQVEFRTQTITPGKARGRLLGGNLTVLTTILGSPYLPDWDGAILFCEDVREDLYRVDRMLTQLKLAGILGKIKGFVFGGCSECGPGDGNYGALTLEEIFNDHIKPLAIPAWQGAMIGHAQPQWTLPVGAQVEIDAAAGTIALLEPVVS
ncbi:MAG TPA: LD-carboxypeptidase [Vicinamibacterales bacterium]|nr:LD-carboxypeptidase [Vicinamibacterales bacterium]